jgi:hypothetical protein
MDALYVSPAHTGKAYRTVMIDPPVVTFDRNWHLNDQTGQYSTPMHPAEIEDITNALPSAFLKIFAAELAASGYQPVVRALEDTLHVSPGLVDVYLNTPPGRRGRLKTYSGGMTLVMELRDGPTGQLLARIVDKEIGDLGMLHSPNTVLNSDDFRSAVQTWA